MMKRGRLITIGSFDGVHLGHQALLSRTVTEARRRKMKSLALTFAIPPRMVLDAHLSQRILSDAKEKEILLKNQGVDEVMFLDFDQKIASVKPFSFFRSVLLKELGAKGLVVGADFRFGMQRSAGALELVRWGEEFEIPVWVISPVRHQRKIVSSSIVRHLLETHHFKKALGFLGHPYLIGGKVVPGKKLGRKLGFPTANLKTTEGKILPRGVYAVRAWVSGFQKRWLGGVCNIGTRPTVSSHPTVSVEVHLFDCNATLTGRYLRIELLSRIRNEKKFTNLDHLKQAIAGDCLKAQSYLSQKIALN